ncbi:hypothetical protein HOLleu_12077 [Holothuria leucospilota]|uniref:Uncharacterized protein n=1 Tax=Holothuria leucospilota TaxID=206669 RepID=A0A9Q1H9V2_HOLLE|nr:hypothetical protein HOLleu_12077 [Holothuria leucospilota]
MVGNKAHFDNIEEVELTSQACNMHEPVCTTGKRPTPANDKAKENAVSKKASKAANVSTDKPSHVLKAEKGQLKKGKEECPAWMVTVRVARVSVVTRMTPMQG